MTKVVEAFATKAKSGCADRQSDRACKSQESRVMKTRLTLKPGQNGTKHLLHKYGDRLLAVRYRYDPVACRRMKTVELLEEELPWNPPPEHAEAMSPSRNLGDKVLIRVAYDELELRQLVKSQGAQWDQTRKLWALPYGIAVSLALTSRIVE